MTVSVIFSQSHQVCGDGGGRGPLLLPSHWVKHDLICWSLFLWFCTLSISSAPEFLLYILLWFSQRKWASLFYFVLGNNFSATFCAPVLVWTLSSVNHTDVTLQLPPLFLLIPGFPCTAPLFWVPLLQFPRLPWFLASLVSFRAHTLQSFLEKRAERTFLKIFSSNLPTWFVVWHPGTEFWVDYSALGIL